MRLLAVALCAAVLLLLFGVAELALRARGGKPWHPQSGQIGVEPGGRLYRADPLVGYMPREGRYRIRLPNGHAFSATHDADGLRAVSSGSGPRSPRPGLWIFGGSFAYGWSLDDEDALPWRVQERRPDLAVTSFAVSGFGTLQALLQLRRGLETRPAPRIALLAYAPFHERRNTFLRSRRKRVAPYNQLGPLVQPYARLDPDGGLRIRMAEVAYRPWPGMRYSALIHAAEQRWNEFEERRIDSEAVTHAILREFAEVARARGAEPVLAVIARGAGGETALRVARGEGMRAGDISVDLDVPGLRNLPHDEHPSARAASLYAERLLRLLDGLVPSS